MKKTSATEKKQKKILLQGFEPSSVGLKQKKNNSIYKALTIELYTQIVEKMRKNFSLI